jgi:hypothetical protein
MHSKLFKSKRALTSKQLTAKLLKVKPKDSQPKLSKKQAEWSYKAMRLDPDIQAQQYLSLANTISGMSANDQASVTDDEMATFYKVTDPIHYFIRRSDDFRRRPREGAQAFENRKLATAKGRCARYLKKYPKHTKGRIDRRSTIGWVRKKKRTKAEPGSNLQRFL